MSVINLPDEIDDAATLWDEIPSTNYKCPYRKCEKPTEGYIVKVDPAAIHKYYDSKGNLEREETDSKEDFIFAYECRGCGREVNVVKQN